MHDASCTKLNIKNALSNDSVNNAMQGPCGPCEGYPYENRTDLAAGAVMAPFDVEITPKN